MPATADNSDLELLLAPLLLALVCVLLHLVLCPGPGGGGRLGARLLARRLLAGGQLARVVKLLLLAGVGALRPRELLRLALVFARLPRNTQ
jgi:hypothetical protein